MLHGLAAIPVEQYIQSYTDRGGGTEGSQGGLIIQQEKFSMVKN